MGRYDLEIKELKDLIQKLEADDNVDVHVTGSLEEIIIELKNIWDDIKWKN